MVEPTRLYGAAIAGASGIYSVWSATSGAEMGASGWVMLGVGVVVIVHGVVLLTSLVDSVGGWSGPLMILWAGIMLLNQVLLSMDLIEGGGPPMDVGMGTPANAMAWDPAMVLFAVLMLASGVIMSRDRARGGM